ncbi:MAG: Membrane-bound lytic murein transglycosylase A precursor [Planctomycetes bacterium ADurb.Bin126]|nr:MAG: Membrane-bound lytic murein transglycosylase A precursor [Planctomycetes bacterium ADurb.Bin126]HOD83889.1 MltA domain-containing protein [Phycisphaerae bacterium]
MTSRTHATWILTAVCASLLLGGCPRKKLEGDLSSKIEKDYTRPLAPGELALEKITDPSQIPDFTRGLENPFNLREAIAHSLTYLAKPSSQKYFPYASITHAEAVASLKAFDELLASGKTAAQMNAEIRQRFDVWRSKGWDGSGTVLFTGYYTPIFDASLTPTDKFCFPLYKQPPWLMKTPEGQVLGMKTADGQIVPAPDRRTLESSGMLKGLEVVYLADAFEVFIVQVQGSAKLRMPGGELVTYGYTATNGLDYKSVRNAMIAQGLLPKTAGLKDMISYFKAHPQQVQQYTWLNPRYVFFDKVEGDVRGCLNVPVTAMRSIATDKDVYPRACLAFVDVPLPRKLVDSIETLPYKGFALDQDAGGAIRAPGRCDVYMGVGDIAGQLAGRAYQEGFIYYLFVKPGATIPTTAPAIGGTP